MILKQQLAEFLAVRTAKFIKAFNKAPWFEVFYLWLKEFDARVKEGENPLEGSGYILTDDMKRQLEEWLADQPDAFKGIYEVLKKIEEIEDDKR